MNFFHCPIKIISRNKGRSAVAASAYISATRMENTWDGTTHDYTRKRHVVYAEVMLPKHAPPEYADRNVLWEEFCQGIFLPLCPISLHNLHLALVPK